MKFCHEDPEICRGQVHGPRKERIIIIRRKEAKTISLQTLFERLNNNDNNNKKRSKNNKSPKRYIIRVEIKIVSAVTFA